MKDIYTKTLLTVIAICLVWLCFSGITPIASAQADVQKVILVGWDRPLPVILVDEKERPWIDAQGLRVNSGDRSLQVSVANQSVPVTVGNQTVPVAIKAIERGETWQAIQVDVSKAPAARYPGQ